ncbi:MAG: acetoacetate--CoA ligase [Phycisphaerales bacterium]|nr:MAG: acetoacetate--CoA ligase [Phycisphaerales bacterium]
MGDILWTPSPQRVARTRLHRFMLEMAAAHGFPPDWPSLHAWSIRNRDAFWQAMLQLAEIAPTMPATAVREGSGMLGTRWFPGMTLNYAAHLLRFDDDRAAIVAEDELGRTRSLTRRQLRESVARCAAALQAAGVEKGDRVAGFVPNVPEAVIAMLAAASLGAIWSSCSPDFGIGGVFDRFGQIEPKVLFAAEAYSYNGKRIDSLDRVRGVVERIPSIGCVVVFGYLQDAPDLSSLAAAAPGKCVAWRDFLDDAPPRPPAFEPVPFDHPLFIMYSSGTTGVPKCIVHGHGGTLLQHMKELMLHCDLTAEDRSFYFTTCGWMMWNWVVSSLGVGATLVLYEGSPSHPDVHHLWKMAERTGVTVFGTSPKFLSACQKAGIAPGRDHDLSRLRCVLSTGSPLTVENFEWVYANVRQDLQLSSISGGTDIISCFMLGNPILPVRAGEIQCLGLGMDVHAFDEDSGNDCIGRKGELVCRTAFPSRPVCFWNDPDGELYRKAYFDHYPGVWRHGDFIEITEHGGVIVYGRSDATLNPGGVRIGTAEIYRIVEGMEEVVDSLVVGRQTADDVEICLFVVLRGDRKLDAALEMSIRDRIAEGATRRHVPKHIRQVSAVPYTISGKKVELAVTRLLAGEEVKNRDALANPESLDQYPGIV